MATLIPTLGAARFDACGELCFVEWLKDCLEDNAWVWHNIPVGPFGRHPDFLTLKGNHGVRSTTAPYTQPPILVVKSSLFPPSVVNSKKYEENLWCQVLY